VGRQVNLSFVQLHTDFLVQPSGWLEQQMVETHSPPIQLYLGQ